MHVALLSLLLAGTVAQSTDRMVVADTFLDKSEPTANYGRDPILSGGRDKAILVRFPQLGQTMGAGQKVQSANLTMTLVSPATVSLKSVSRMLKPWGEGGAWFRDYQDGNKPRFDGDATWNDAQAGDRRLKWNRGGAADRADAEIITGVTANLVEGVVTFTGLESAVQRMIDNPQANYGLRIEFDKKIDLFSSDSLAPGPTLNITFADEQKQAAPDLTIISCEPLNFNPSSPPETGTEITWEVNVINNGDVATTSQLLTWSYAHKAAGSRQSSTNIGAGEILKISFTLPWEEPAPNRVRQALSIRVSPADGDLNPSDNGTTIYTGALAIAFTGITPTEAVNAIQAIQKLNERVFPFSKFNMAPKGCLERLRYVSDSAKAHIVIRSKGENLTDEILRALTSLPDKMVRPYIDKPPVVTGLNAAGYIAKIGQVGLLPDTRDDILVPRPMPIPDRTSTTRLFTDPPMREHRMLSRTETVILNQQIGKPASERALPWEMTPSAIFFKIISTEGVVPTGATLEVFQMVGGAFGSQPVFTTQLERDGIALMPSRPSGAFGHDNPYGNLAKDGSNSWLLAIVRTGTSSHTSWIPVWQLWDEYARGNTAGGFVEVRVNLVSNSLDRDTNLALNKLVTDSKERFPAQLMSIVDGKTDTSIALANEGENYWLEIDLGRDRHIGEIGLVFDGPVWKQFRIATYKTAQNANVAQIWSEEANGPGHPELEKTEDGKTILRYRSKSIRSRFLRIIPLSNESVKLAEVLVVPVKN